MHACKFKPLFLLVDIFVNQANSWTVKWNGMCLPKTATKHKIQYGRYQWCKVYTSGAFKKKKYIQVGGPKLMSFTNVNNDIYSSWILHFGWYLHHQRNRRSSFYFLVATQQNCLESKAKQGLNHNCQVMGSLSALEKVNAKCQWQHKENTEYKRITSLSYSFKFKEMKCSNIGNVSNMTSLQNRINPIHWSMFITL